MQATKACRAQCASARTHSHKLRQDDTCAGDARFMGRARWCQADFSALCPGSQVQHGRFPSAVWYRLFIEWPCRPQGVSSAQKLGPRQSCQAHLPRVLAVHSVGFEPWPVIHRGAPPDHAKMRHRCVARVKTLRDQTQHEEVGGFEGWYLRQALKQVWPAFRS